MTALRPRTAPHAGPGLRAGLVASVSDEMHVVESGFAGLTALCGAGSITRPLRASFDERARNACPECARLASAPAAVRERADLLL
jgi:hypothetical protein